MKRYEFTDELTDKAMNVYSNSDFTFYQDADGTFYGADNPSTSDIYRLGTLEYVEEFLLQFAEDEEDEY